MTLTPQQVLKLMEQVSEECGVRLSIVARIFQLSKPALNPSADTVVETFERLEQIADRCQLKVSKVSEVLASFVQRHAQLVAENDFLRQAESSLRHGTSDGDD